MTDDFDLLGAALPTRPAAPPTSELVPAGVGGEVAMGAFEGADRFNSSIALWGAGPLKSPDLEILPNKRAIESRSRDMLRNDPFVQGGAALRKDNIVGSHYLLNCRPATRIVRGKQDDVWEAEFQEEVEEKWELYADSPDHWIDAARTNNFTSLVRLAIGVHLMSGELLATAEWVTDDGAPYSTAIQMVDIDRLSTPMDMSLPAILMNPDQRDGILYNRRGAPQTYYIRNTHPLDYGPVNFQLPKWTPVDLRKPWGRLQVIHLFEQLRPDQSRGVTEMASALKMMKMSHSWRDITVQHAVSQALYAAAITTERPDADIMSRMGVGDSPQAFAEAISNWSEGYLASVAKYVGEKGVAIDGVRIPRLYPGEKLELMSAANNGPLGTEFEQSLLRSIAASLGVSYEQLSRDYTNTNYSSARAAMTETWKFMQAQKKLIADRFATLCFRLWLEEAINAGDITTAAGIKIYGAPRRGQRFGRLNQNFDALSRCDWIGASRGQIDEMKETQAAVLRVNSGLSTWEDELARLGKDWRKVYRQLKREQDLRDTLKLTFAMDSSTVAKAATQPVDDTTAPAPAKKGGKQ